MEPSWNLQEGLSQKDWSMMGSLLRWLLHILHDIHTLVVVAVSHLFS